ncbi:MAG: bifunctional acetate--CoA ligase family protein/GNAT family N-acetyltransferase [Chlamydia sp.]
MTQLDQISACTIDSIFWDEGNQHPLDALFLPKTVAVIGAKEGIGTVGHTIMVNLLAGEFPGRVVGVNPKRNQVLGCACYPSILDIPFNIDLAIIVVPAQAVLEVMKECAQKRVKGVVIISAGFKEVGVDGLHLEQQILEIARIGQIRIIGPNCLGVMNPIYGLNASFAKGMPLKGSLAFISQSGAMCTAVLDWSYKTNVGFSSFVSIGSMVDVNWGDLIEYFGQDEETKAILIYMETVGDPEAFMSAARGVALDKPIIVIKPGKSLEAQKAAASHTGSLSGSDEVFDAACARAGILRVQSISQLFSMAEVLSCQPKPKGPNLAIITNAGGPSVLATDSVIEHGAQIASLSEKTIAALGQFLPAAWSHGNPIDILGDATPDRYEKTILEIAKDPFIDGILVIVSPQDMTDSAGIALALSRASSLFPGKPILASWMGGASVQKGKEILYKNNIPSFDYPDDASWSFATMWRYSQLIKGLNETPFGEIEKAEERIELRKKASELIKTIQASGRTLMTEDEAKRLFHLYGIPVVTTIPAATLEEAGAAAEKIGYPVVLKLHSKTITHKSDIGGVQLNLCSKEAVENAYHLIYSNVLAKYGDEHFQGVTVQKMVDTNGIELILGSSIDPQFGPIILFGAGGIYVEIMKDKALGLPPLNSTLAKLVMQKTKIFQTFGGFRGKKITPPNEIARILVRFSEMIAENPEIVESDINPLLASESEVIALDARCVISSISDKKRVVAPAIRPYPIEYITFEELKNGEEILIRPIRAEDEPLLIQFHKELSDDSVKARYFDSAPLDERTAHERLIRICYTDFRREIALVAIANESIAGVIRITRIVGMPLWDLKLIVADRFQGYGIGSKLMKRGLLVSEQEGVQEVTAKLLYENEGMLSLLETYKFSLKDQNEGSYLFSKTIL